MRQLLKRILSPVLKPVHAAYLKKPRRYTYNEISVMVEPGVFPPFLTLSTKILLDYIEPMPLQGKRFLELGCGCGIISILAAKKGAIVTASDINQTALDALLKNAQANLVDLNIVHSDLFEKFEGRGFDYIVINPPYYPKNAKNVAEHAWYCGENFEYFQKLFAQLPAYFTDDNLVYMILSEDCDIGRIKGIASVYNIGLDLALEQKSAGEKNFIFRCRLNF